MSFNQSVISTQRALLQQSNLQKNGNKLRDNLRQLQKTVNSLKMRHSSQLIDFIQQQCKHTKQAIKDLKQTRTRGRSQLLQKQNLVSFYSHQLQRILHSFQAYQQSLNQTSSPIFPNTHQLQPQTSQDQKLSYRKSQLTKIENTLQQLNEFIKFCYSKIKQQSQFQDENPVNQSKRGVLELQTTFQHPKSQNNISWAIALLAILAVLILAIVLILTTKQMEETFIRQNHADLHTLISRQGSELNWTEIHEDLQDLDWLDSDTHKEDQVIRGVWDVVDRWGVSLLQDTPRFQVLKLPTVTPFISKVITRLSAQRDRMKLVSVSSKSAISQLLFLKKGKNLLHAAVQDQNFTETVNKVASTYTDIKKSYLTTLMHLDKYFTNQVKQNLSNSLDEQFNKNIILPLKHKLLIDHSTRPLVYQYDKDYAPVFTSFNYQASRHGNHYTGELDEHENRSGYGKIRYANGDTYQGFWSKNRPHGKGLYIWKDLGYYQGDYLDGAMNGTGKRVYRSGNQYQGEFFQDRKQGKGRMKYRNGDVYDGQWHNDDMHGEGIYTWRTQDFFMGKFKKDKRDGFGTLTLSTGEVFQAEWKEGVMINNSQRDAAQEAWRAALQRRQARKITWAAQSYYQVTIVRRPRRITPTSYCRR